MIKNKRAALLGLVILLLCVTALSLTFGQIPVPVKNTLAVVCHQTGLPFFTEKDFTWLLSAIRRDCHFLQKKILLRSSLL